MTNKNDDWQPLNLQSLIDKLSEAKSLVEQAAALAAASDGERIRALTELENQNQKEQSNGPGARRRYR